MKSNIKIYRLLFILLSIIVIILATGSFSNDPTKIYTSWLVISLWVIVSGLSLFLIIRSFNTNNLLYCILHLSFIIILAGAFITHLTGKEDEIHLRIGETTNIKYYSPTNIKLQDCRIDYYTNTMTPRNYISTVSISTEKETVSNQNISVNKPLKTNGHRIFLTSFDSDQKGVTFSLTTDPYGTAVTYFGYFLFFHLVPLVLIKGLRKKV
ncbi:MAG: cytochrome c biogenesis protein ResB [Bacteroidales bacterium]|jgi:cytochrome c biogenesis factor|nr:cytochrome c biogenesis protein ResB [Bacteroidales bacterium]